MDLNWEKTAECFYQVVPVSRGSSYLTRVGALPVSLSLSLSHPSFQEGISWQLELKFFFSLA